MAPSVLDHIDSVYMFLWHGWARELRSNRWHFARRWAARKPVVLLQPDGPAEGAARERAESRIANCAIVSVRGAEDPRSYPLDALVQSGQIARYMAGRGHTRPLFWFYNPFFFGSFALLPAVTRVVHATENFFDWERPRLPPLFLELHRAALQASPAAVAVSSGVAAGVRAESPGTQVVLSTNGCDFEEYADPRPDPGLASERPRFRRIAIYAGNVNARLDFALLERCADAEPETLFAIYGPVAGIAGDDQARWLSLTKRANVRHFGPVPPERLPGLYGAADVGLIPYKRTVALEKNGFPLKALEMAATTLPVVSTFMEPLMEVADVIRIARDPGEFVSALATADRARQTGAERSRMIEVSRARGYDVRFAEVLAALPVPSGPPSTRGDLLASLFPPEAIQAALSRASESLPARIARRAVETAKRAASPVWSRLPRSWRSRLRGSP